MVVTNFSEMAAEFLERVAKIVWCTVSTVDRKGRVRSRILHPIWEGNTGWIATGRRSHKAKHLEANPYVSLSYWDQDHQQIYADCEAMWEDDQAEKERIWQLYADALPPLGYPLEMIWQGGKTDPSYGLLKLRPWRIEMSALSDMMGQTQPRIWHAPDA
jgi:general stress protein 26